MKRKELTTQIKFQSASLTDLGLDGNPSYYTNQETFIVSIAHSHRFCDNVTTQIQTN